MNSLPSIRAAQFSQLLVEQDKASDSLQEESIMDEPGSVTAQIVAELDRGTSAEEEANADTEEDSPIEETTD